ncbi:hypothetical protein V2J09_010426 [Rumex salicifolius]
MGGRRRRGCFDKFLAYKCPFKEEDKNIGSLPKNTGELHLWYLQDNQLSGELPSALLERNLIFNYTGNIDLHEGGDGGSQRNLIIGVSVGAAFLILAAIVACILLCRRKKPGKKFFDHGKGDNMGRGISVQEFSSSSADPTQETAHCFPALEIEEATRKFERKIGSGGFGVVYYGKLKDGREIAVKLLTSNSYQSQREFSNEVTLLSRIHHRNLLQFLGYCQEDGKSILVYEFMHNGTLKEHLYGPLIRGQNINWAKRLEIAEDAARGTEYLHTGCVPSIIHRDLKTSNILLDKNMRAKASLNSQLMIAEKALMCVLPHGYMRPSMAEVLKEIQDAILIERERDAVRSVNSDDIVSRHLLNSPAKLAGMLNFDTSMEFPKAR